MAAGAMDMTADEEVKPRAAAMTVQEAAAPRPFGMQTAMFSSSPGEEAAPGELRSTAGVPGELPGRTGKQA
jgi:hypothetical protein